MSVLSEPAGGENFKPRSPSRCARWSRGTADKPAGQTDRQTEAETDRDRQGQTERGTQRGMVPGGMGEGGDYAIAQVTGHVPRNHMEAAPVFDEVTGDPLNDPARVLVGQEPKGYNEVDSLDEAIALAHSRERAISTPRSYDEWAELLAMLTVDNEKPARPQAVDALHRALDAMEAKPVEFVDAIGQWIARRLTGTGGAAPSAHVTLKTLKVVISLLEGVTQDEDEAGVQTGVARFCVSMPSIFSSAESASDLTGSLTGGAGRAGASGNSVGESFSVAIRAHCTELLQELAELDVAPDPQWGERPMQMIRAAARGAMIRAHGQRKDFGVEYSSEKRIPVGAGELVAWVRLTSTFSLATHFFIQM